MKDNSRFVYRILTICAFLLAIVVIILVQFAIPTLYGFDGYLHIRMAELIKDSGPIHNFHWARLSTFYTHFADKSFFYHLMLIPFTLLPDIFFGAKLSACFFAILFLFIFFIALRKYSTHYLIPIFIIASLFSCNFLVALSMPRPMNAATILSLLALYLLIEKRLIWLCVVTVVYCLTHVSGPYLLFYAFLTEMIRFFCKKEFYFKSIIAVFLCIIASYLIHPNFPNNFLAFYLNGILVPIYAFQGKLEMGSELVPLSTKQFLYAYPLVILGLLFLLSLAIFAHPKTKTKFFTKVMFVYSALFIILSFFATRFITHAYPLFLLLLASSTSNYFQGNPPFKMHKKNKILAAVSIVSFSVLLFLLTVVTYRGLRFNAAVFKVRNGARQRAAEWMSKNIPAGEMIFHTSWYDGSVFSGLNPQNDYLVALHPIYMYHAGAQIYDLYRNISYGRCEDVYSVLKYAFKVRYGYAEKGRGYGLIEQLRDESRFKIVYEDEEGLIFKLDAMAPSP